MEEFVGGVSVINGACPSSFKECSNVRIISQRVQKVKQLKRKGDKDNKSQRN